MSPNHCPTTVYSQFCYFLVAGRHLATLGVPFVCLLGRCLPYKQFCGMMSPVQLLRADIVFYGGKPISSVLRYHFCHFPSVVCLQQIDKKKFFSVDICAIRPPPLSHFNSLLFSRRSWPTWQPFRQRKSQIIMSSPPSARCKNKT